ncbi:MAG: exodeoxyribonuclease III [Bdellovibrionales bacterium]|nr:exodeoxyribonuclease III [Bdellovibrionales bacterium]
MRIVTWNINGLRAVSQKGFRDWFTQHGPDIIALQEIKATTDDVKGLLELWKDEYEVYLNPAERKGYSGTALMIKRGSPQPIKINVGIDIPKFDIEGRFIWAEYADFYLLTGYFPNGKDDHSRVDYKLEFSREVLKLAKKLSKKKGVLITGDLNTAHTEIDLARPKSNLNSTGFLPHERAFLDEMIKDGFDDAFRVKYPGKKDEYTWWTYRGGCREKNIGWRLDYFFIDQKIKERLIDVLHHQEILGSDHCPVEIIF